jgi:ATP-dependent helicase/nuclease subunit B
MAFKRIWHQTEVLAALDAGAVVVAPGERLARATRLAYGEAQQAAGRRVWERPRVLSYAAFIDDLYDNAVDAALGDGKAPPRRLTAAAMESHWEEAVRASAQSDLLLQTAATAREAARSWELAFSYRISLERIAAGGDEDSQAFAGWAAHFAAASRQGGWLEDARLADWLATQARAGALTLAPRFLFIGFDELTPQQQELVQSLRAAGSGVEVLEMRATAADAAHRLEDDPAAERRAAAAWARSILQRDAAASIGIVVRDLEQQRSALARALDDALCPGAAAGQITARPYDISLGLALDSFPVVHAALLTLELLARRTPFLTVSALLRGPFLEGADAERDARARLELKLRERVSEQVGLQALMDFAGQFGVPRLSALLASLKEKAAALPARQKPSAWARDFSDVLSRAGWPGERAPDSTEYQAVMSLRDVVGEMVHLDAALGPVSLGEALSRLKRLAAAKLFQPAGADAPVQVMGLLETAGLAFDHLWIMGLTDEAWPAAPRPAAFIPPRLQREHGVPHASAALELAFARRVTERLLASASAVIASTPDGEGDTPLRPSPLLAHLPPAQITLAEAVGYAAQLQQEYPRAAQKHADMQAPPLQAQDRSQGGTWVMRSQAACPFQAFGRYRLGAKRLEEPALGPDALERGELMHQVLQAVWAELKDHAGLMQRDAATRRTLVEKCAARAVAARSAKLPDVYTPRVAALERERLVSAVCLWLEKEAARPPFRVVEAEARHLLKVGPLSLETRIDRIDELPDGSRVILDYKTGSVDVKGWLDARPDEPQLPLYAVGNPERLAGIAFACLKPGEMRFAGLAERDVVAQGVMAYAQRKDVLPEAPDWEALLGYWKTNLTALAEQHAAGDARVDPKREQTCQRCHLAGVCRIHELGTPEAEDSDE